MCGRELPDTLPGMDWGVVLAVLSLLVAALALIPAFIAIGQARKSNTISNSALNKAYEANELSRTANQIAEETKDYTVHQLEVVTEAHDVRWELGWDGKKTTLVNCGRDDTAYQVKMRITIEDETQSAETGELAPGAGYELTFPETVQRHALTVDWVHTEYEISWVTRLGNQKHFRHEALFRKDGQ